MFIIYQQNLLWHLFLLSFLSAYKCWTKKNHFKGEKKCIFNKTLRKLWLKISKIYFKWNENIFRMSCIKGMGFSPVFPLCLTPYLYRISVSCSYPSHQLKIIMSSFSVHFNIIMLYLDIKRSHMLHVDIIYLACWGQYAIIWISIVVKK